jgi:hypothetical protein
MGARFRPGLRLESLFAPWCSPRCRRSPEPAGTIPGTATTIAALAGLMPNLHSQYEESNR